MAVRRIEPDTTQATELRDLLIVVRRALLLVVSFWENWSGGRYPSTHPYRQAVAMVVNYIERRYGV